MEPERPTRDTALRAEHSAPEAPRRSLPSHHGSPWEPSYSATQADALQRMAREGTITPHWGRCDKNLGDAPEPFVNVAGSRGAARRRRKKDQKQRQRQRQKQKQ